MSNKKLETEEKTSHASFNPNSGNHTAQKQSETEQLEGNKENLNSQNKNSSENKQPFKPKSIGHYILGKTIGEGTFGKVKLATHIFTGEKVAVKVLEKERIIDVTDVERVAREIHILKLVRHPNIIQLYEIIETPKQLYLVTEFAKGGELFDYIVAQTKINEAEACRFFHQLIAGIEYIHKLNVVHRDLKPENLLFDENKNIKIVDFGLSNTYQDKELLKTACGSPCYAAPEMIEGKKYQGLTVDVWSCGVILFAMICGYLPFEDPNTSVLYKKILGGEYTIPKFISAEAKDLIKKILNIDPETRFKIDDIRKHTWMTQVKLIREPTGIILGLHKMPIDYEILRQCEQYGFNADYIEKCLDANKHNQETTSYYLMLKKHIQKGGKSVADYNAESFELKLIKHSGSRKIRAMSNNLFDQNQDSNTDIGEKERQRDASFNVHKLAESLFEQISTKDKKGKDMKPTAGSSSRDQAMEANNKRIPAKKEKLNSSDFGNGVSHSRDNSFDSQLRQPHHRSRETNDNSMYIESQIGVVHKPVVRNNYHHQHHSTQKAKDEALVMNQEKGSNNKQLREKLRDMLQSNKMPGDFVDSNTGMKNTNPKTKENSLRHFKKPKDLSLTNDYYDDGIRSDVKSIGNATSMNPNILDELTSNNTQKQQDSSFYLTPKNDSLDKNLSENRYNYQPHYTDSRDHLLINDGFNNSAINQSMRQRNNYHQVYNAGPRPLVHQSNGRPFRRPVPQQKAPPTLGKPNFVPKEPSNHRPQLMAHKEGVAYRTKQFLSKQTHNRTVSTDQRQQRKVNPVFKTQEKPRALSQQARRDKSFNSSGINYDNSMDDSINASFILNNNKYFPPKNYSFDVGPRAKTSKKGDRPALNMTMQYPNLKERNSSKDAILDGKYLTGGMLNGSAKKNFSGKKLLI